MSIRDIDSLLNRGKHYVCQYVTNGCYEQSGEKTLDGGQLVEKHLHDHDHRRVHQVIDHLLDYRYNCTAEELVEWIKHIVGGRRLPNNFAKEVKSYDTSSKCGLVWTTNFVAYRCRTCAISLCMSLCTDCFLNGNHEGHDFNMFRSQAGGACDCGDPIVMKEQGFCRHHQPKCADPLKKPLPPNSLLCIANEIVPRLLYYLVLFLRDTNFPSNKKADALLSDVLIYLNDLGTMMQDIICKALTDPILYKNCLTEVNKEDNLDYQYRIRTFAENYRKALQEIHLSNLFPGVDTTLIADYDFLNEIESFKPELVHKSFLEEIIFWTILNEFPSNLITFLLKMLPNEDYKTHFAETFVKHYFRISMLILHPPERFLRNAERDIFYNKLANAVVHVSVQLFSNENLALQLCERSKLLYINIISLKYAVEGNRKNYWGILVPNILLNSNDKHLELKSASDSDTKSQTSSDENSLPRVVNCDDSILRLHRFWPIVSDLNNLFTHERVALYFFGDDTLIDLWLEFIMSFQAMNMNKKQRIVDDNNMNYKSAYLSELEICASQMWTLISHLKDETTRPLAINFVKHSLKWLQNWLRALKLDVTSVDVERCSFHLPLHRYYSIFMHHAVTVQNVPLGIMLPNNLYDLKSLIIHPLQTMIAFQHVMSGLWVSNGLQIKTQAINYMQPHFCNSTIDADTFLIQQVACRVKPNEFIDLFANSYGLKPYMHFYPMPSIDQDKVVTFLENAFTFLATLVSQHIKLGPTATEVKRKEMVALLSISEKTHSQIHDLLPYKSGHLMNDSFIEILNDIAEYKSPEVEASGSLVQGYFYPKNQIWEQEFDPLFILYRNSYRRDYQTSLQRFAAVARQSGRYTSNSLPWPPFRVPAPVDSRFLDPRHILKSRLLHSFYFSILIKALNDSSLVTEHLLSIVIYLMELTLIEAPKDETEICNFSCEPEAIDYITEDEFENWFPFDDLANNFMIRVKKIQTCELKFGSQNLKTKFLVNFFNSLMHDNYNFLDEYMGLGNPTVIVESEDGDYTRVENDFHLGDYFGGESSQFVDDDCNYLESVEEGENNAHDDDDDLDDDDDDDDQHHHHHRHDIEDDDDDVNVDENDDDADDDEESYSISQSNKISIDPPNEVDDIDHPSASTSHSNSVSLRKQSKTSRSSKMLALSKRKPLRFESDMDESFLSLLLKLYSKLSGKRDSFKTDPDSLSAFDLTSRIGDGPYFIGCLLRRFILVSAKRIALQMQCESIDKSDNVPPCNESCLEKMIALVDQTRRKIWPNLASTTPEPSTSCNTASQPSPSTSSMEANALDANAQSDMMDIDMKELERMEKKKRALELRQQIMNKFRHMQDTFIQNNKDISDDERDKCCGYNANSANAESEPAHSDSDPFTQSTQSNESQVKYESKSYQCIICGVSGFSTLERSFVQMVLLQSTSVLGNAQARTLSEEIEHTQPSHVGMAIGTDRQSFRSKAKISSQIPVTDEEYSGFIERKTFANYFEERVDTFHGSFAQDSWLSSFSIGWFGGIHAQSCGHLMHMDCYQSYISSVYQNREANDLIEYSCPLCRKAANSVLPIIPNFANLYAVVKSRNNKNSQGVAIEILDLLSNGDKCRLANTTEDESKFLKVLAMAIEDVMKATEPQYRNIRVEPSPQSLFLFLSSISRSNIEYNILLWRDNMLRTNQQAACFVHLFQALSLNAKLVLPMHFTCLWSQITGINSDEDNGSNLLPFQKHVPLLLKDPSAILLQLLYALPFNIDKAYFSSIAQALLNLNFIQAIVLITYQMPYKQRLEIKLKVDLNRETTEEIKFSTIFDYIAFIMSDFDPEPNCLSKDIFSSENQGETEISENVILIMIAKICLPFLRVASMLLHMLYHQSALPEYKSAGEHSDPMKEFAKLAMFLGLGHDRPKSNNELTNIKNLDFYHTFLNWMENEPNELIKTWYREFDKFVQINTMTALNLVKGTYVLRQKPRLLQLPAVYEQLFMFYHKRTCLKCHNVPKDASICLICGRLLCVRENCCRTGLCLEGVTHSKKCGAGTAIYLAINSSSIIVIRGRKACIWGSVYLDEFGEEDRDLKRGKPLYLCKERYKILEQQWLTHSFLNINKKWVYHKESL